MWQIWACMSSNFMHWTWLFMSTLCCSYFCASCPRHNPYVFGCDGIISIHTLIVSIDIAYIFSFSDVETHDEQHKMRWEQYKMRWEREQHKKWGENRTKNGALTSARSLSMLSAGRCWKVIHRYTLKRWQWRPPIRLAKAASRKREWIRPGARWEISYIIHITNQ